MPLKRDSDVALYIQIAENLRQAIAAGNFGASGRIPPEKALMERFGVSRVTIRLAVGHLLNEGLVVRKQGKGTFVVGSTVRHELGDLKGFYDVLVSQGLRPETELLKFEPSVPPPDIADALGGVKTRLMLLQRLYRLEQTPIGLATTWLPSKAKSIPWVDAEQHFSYSILQDILGLCVARAEIAIRGQLAGPELARLLELDKVSAVLILERKSFGLKNEPLEFTRFAVNSETYKFTLEAQGSLPLSTGVTMSAIEGR